MRRFRYNRIIWLRHDLPAGLSVFFVAIPLCLGIALASGAPLYSGLLSGIIGGVVVSLASGSALSVSGPAAGLTTLVAVSIGTLGDFQTFLLAVIVAGLFQVLLGALRLGIISHYFPSSVIKGMLAAIGIMLMANQLPVALGYDQPDFWTGGFVHLFDSGNFFGQLDEFRMHLTPGAILITLLSLIVLGLFQLKTAKRLKFIPAPLVAVILASLFAFAFSRLTPALALRPAQFVQIPGAVLSQITFPDLSRIFSDVQIWKYGALIGGLASLETLLCVEAVDKLDHHNRITPVNREMFAQGIGNMLCGLLGAIPMTAVVVRGAANANAGGRTRMASFTHGVLLLLAVLLIPWALNLIPYAALAAVLLITGYNLSRPSMYTKMWMLGWKQFLPFVITILMVLCTDLLIGVSIGLILSIYFIIQSNFKIDYQISKTTEFEIDHYYIKLNRVVTFLNKVKLRHALEQIPEYSVLTIDGTESSFIDHDILEVISEFEQKAHDRHIETELKNIRKVSLTSHH